LGNAMEGGGEIAMGSSPQRSKVARGLSVGGGGGHSGGGAGAGTGGDGGGASSPGRGFERGGNRPLHLTLASYRLGINLILISYQLGIDPNLT
jgi:hypothetical protein